MKVPFAETVFILTTGENVALAGTMDVKLLLVGDVTTGWTGSLKASLHQTLGTGSTSGASYAIKGRSKDSIQYPPGPPATPGLFQPSFTVHPPSPCRQHHPPGPCFNSSTLIIPVSATFNADGSIAGVGVGHSN